MIFAGKLCKGIVLPKQQLFRARRRGNRRDQAEYNLLTDLPEYEPQQQTDPETTEDDPSVPERLHQTRDLVCGGGY